METNSIQVENWWLAFGRNVEGNGGEQIQSPYPKYRCYHGAAGFGVKR
jgi:hypothetical protein